MCNGYGNVCVMTKGMYYKAVCADIIKSVGMSRKALIFDSNNASQLQYKTYDPVNPLHFFVLSLLFEINRNQSQFNTDPLHSLRLTLHKQKPLHNVLMTAVLRTHNSLTSPQFLS
jgi:hypothetical protein